MSSNTRTRSKGYMPTIVFKTILADRSASMETFNGKQYDMVEHLLNDAKKQASETNKKTHVKFVTFDGIVKTIIDQDISSYNIDRDVIEDAMKPSGSTRFNDTLIEEIDSLILKKENYLQSLSNEARALNPDIAMVLIAITDGEDNASMHSMEDAREEMLQFRQNGGRAILMAANMDAEVIGARYGFNPEKSITVHNSNPTAIESCYRAVSDMARNLSQGIDVSFTPVERASSQALPQLQGNTGLPQLQRAVAMPFNSNDDNDYHPLSWTNFNDTLVTPPTLTRQHRQ